MDIETFSPVELRGAGVYRYSDDPLAEVMLFQYAFDDDPARVVDLMAGERLPPRVLQALTNPKILKFAFNANFERVMIQACLRIDCDPAQWRCTMVQAAYLGFPGTLKDVNERMGIPVDKRKLGIGTRLINLFCKPCRPTRKNNFRVRNLPKHFPQEWSEFKGYGAQDVESERYCARLLNKHPMPEHEWRLWALDQRINDRGVRVYMPLVDRALELHAQVQTALLAEARALTRVDNPGSVQQLLAWLKKEVEPESIEDFDDLQKKTVARLLGTVESPVARRVLQIRQQISKASVTKYRAIQRMRMSDGRVRGLLQFYGAYRTGRWAGRNVQVQNLPQNKIKHIELARACVARGDFETVMACFDDVARLLSELLRTAFIPEGDKILIPVDYKAIEARVIAWLANEEWRLQVFRTHGMIYEASASQMFGVAIELIKKGGPREELRQKGKIAELALGFQGATGALITMGALEMGLAEADLLPLVRAWREANPAIVALWYQVEADARQAIRTRSTVRREHYGFTYEDKCLFLRLPGGRRLCYPRAAIVADKDDASRSQIVYRGLNQYTRKWEWVKTYGGKLVENLVQAVARDCLAVLMQRLEPTYPIVMHVHDEAVTEVDRWISKEKIETIASQSIAWAPGLPLGGDASAVLFYQK